MLRIDRGDLDQICSKRNEELLLRHGLNPDEVHYQAYLVLQEEKERGREAAWIDINDDSKVTPYFPPYGRESVKVSPWSFFKNFYPY